MAVALDNSGNLGVTNSVNTKSGTITINGANRLLLVAVQWNQPSNSETVSSITYNGTGLTQVGSTIIAGGSGLDRCTALYKLVAPAIGSNTLAVTMSTSLAFYVGWRSYTGVNQSTPLGTPQTATTTTAATLSTTTPSSIADMVFSVATIRTSSTLTTPTTQEWNAIIGTNNKYGAATQPGASSVTSTYSWTGGDNASMIAVDVLASSSLSIPSQASILGTQLGTVTDTFATADTSKWQNQGGGAWPSGVSVVSGQLNFALSTTYNTLELVNAKDFRDSYAFTQVVQLPSQAADHSTETGFGIHLDINNYFVAIINGSGNIVWRVKTAGVAGTTGYTAYSLTSMAWLRWRNSGATVYLEAAPNIGGPWSVLATYPVTFDLSAVRAYYYAGVYGTVTSPGTAIFDNFNTGTTKTLSSQAHIVATLSHTIFSQATIVESSGLEVGGLGFPGNPIKSIPSRATITAARTVSISSQASISAPADDLSVRPVVGADAEHLYEQLGAWTTQDADNDWALLRFCDALCVNLQVIDDLVRDSSDGVGWSAVMDLERISDDALPWIAQFVGVDTIATLDPTAQRLRISETAGFQRGTVSAIEGAARQYLTGSKSVVITERDTSPYHLTVTTFLAETPDESATAAALEAQKPAGLVLSFVVSSGATCGALKATGDTCEQLDAIYSTPKSMKLAVLV